MKITALIMAGGRGERFWPASTIARPKQFIKIIDEEKTMLQLTVERILPLVKITDLFVVSNEAYIPLIREQCPLIPADNLIAEPYRRNTAACIALASAYIRRLYGDAVLIVLPADQMIEDQETFNKVLQQAVENCQNDKIITIGIKPERPETSYGYIRYKQLYQTVFKVDSFVEKPDKTRAEEYLKAGNYLWNAGIFVFKASLMLKELQKYLPSTAKAVQRIMADYNNKELLRLEYAALDSISIDYAVMEKSAIIEVIPAKMGWDDVGSWLALERFLLPDENGNQLVGKALLYNCHHNLIYSPDKLLVLSDINDAVVVNVKEAVLVCPKADIASLRQMLKDVSKLYGDDCR